MFCSFLDFFNNQPYSGTGDWSSRKQLQWNINNVNTCAEGGGVFIESAVSPGLCANGGRRPSPRASIWKCERGRNGKSICVRHAWAARNPEFRANTVSRKRYRGRPDRFDKLDPQHQIMSQTIQRHLIVSIKMWEINKPRKYYKTEIQKCEIYCRGFMSSYNSSCWVKGWLNATQVWCWVQNLSVWSDRVSEFRMRIGTIPVLCILAWYSATISKCTNSHRLLHLSYISKVRG